MAGHMCPNPECAANNHYEGGGAASLYDRVAATPEGHKALVAAAVRYELAALRAEVEALRDEARRTPYYKRRGDHGAYVCVLDLIDKHAREGQ